MKRYERGGFPIRLVSAGHVAVGNFAESSQLEVMIDLIFTFFDIERENWTRWKHRYACMENNLAKTLFNCVIAIKNNIAFYVRGAKQPVHRITFHKLMVCWQFEPFHQHLDQRRRQTAKRRIDLIEFYYEMFNH